MPPCCHASLLGPSLCRCFLAWVSLRVLIDLACSVGNAQALLLCSVFGSSFLKISYFYFSVEVRPLFRGNYPVLCRRRLIHPSLIPLTRWQWQSTKSGSLVSLQVQLFASATHPGPLVAMQAINRLHDSDYERRNTKRARWL